MTVAVLLSEHVVAMEVTLSLECGDGLTAQGDVSAAPALGSAEFVSRCCATHQHSSGVEIEIVTPQA